MPTIDSLDIQIAASAQKANDAINGLITNLNRLSNALNIDTSRLSNIGKSLNFSKQFKVLSNETKTIVDSLGRPLKTINASMDGMQKKAKQATKSLEKMNEQYKNLGKGFEIKGSAQQIQKQIDSLTNKLANAKLAKDDFEKSGRTNLSGYETAVKNVIKYTNQIESLKKQLEGLQTVRPKLEFNTTGAENAAKYIIDYKKELMDLKKDMQSVSDKFGGLQNAPKGGLDTPIQSLKQSIEELKQSYPQATNVISAFEKELRRLQETSKGLTKEPAKVNVDTNSIDNISKKIAELKDKFDKVGLDFKFTGNFEQLKSEIKGAYTELDKLLSKEKEMISAGQVDTSDFEKLQESIARIGNKIPILEDLRDRTRTFNQSLKQLKVPPINEENLTKLQSALKRTEADTEKLKAKLSNAITMGRIVPNVDDSGFRKLTEQIVLSEKQAETLRGKIRELGGDTGSAGNKMNGLKSSLSNVSSQSNKTSSSTSVLGKNIKNLSSAMSSFNPSANKAISGMKSFTRQVSSAMGVYLGIYGAIQGIKKSITIASDLTEVQNVVDVTFGDMAYKVEEFAKTSIEQFGMSELSLKQYASRFQSMGTAMGISPDLIKSSNKFLNSQTNGYVGLSDSMSDVSLNLTKLTADMASLYNVDQKTVAKDLAAIFTGMTVPLRKYGLDLTQATLSEWAMKQGLDADIKSMSQAEKTMLRYQYVMANTGAAQGDFARTADTWANRTRVLVQQFEQLATVIGKGFVAAFKPFVKTLNAVMGKVIAFSETVLNSLGAIFGWKFEISAGGLTDDLGESAGYTDDLASGAGDASDGYKDAAKNAKKLKDVVLGIDELNINAPDDDTGSGGGSSAKPSGGGGGLGDLGAGAGGLTTNMFATDNMLKAYESSLNTLYKLGEYIGDTLTKAMNSIDWNKVYDTARNFGKGLADFLNGLISPDLFGAVGRTIAGALNTAVYAALSFGKTFNWKEFGLSIATGINEFFNTFDFASNAKSINTWVQGIWETIKTTISNVEWNKVWDGVKGFLSNLDIETVGIILGAITIKKILGLHLASSALSWIGTEISKKIAQAIASKLGVEIAASAGIKTALKTGLLSSISTLWANLGLAIEGIFSGLTVKEALTVAFGGVATTIAGIASTVGGVLLAITNLFSMLKDGFSWLNEILMVVGVALTAVGAIILGAPALVAGVVAGIVATVSTIVVLIRDNWDAIASFFAETIPSWWEGTALPFLQSIPERFLELVQSITNFISDLPERIGYWLGFALGSFVKWVADTASFLVEKIPEIIGNITDWFFELPGKIGDIFGRVIERMREWGKNAISFATEKVPEIADNIINYFKDIPNKMIEIGGDIISGLWKGIQNAWESIKDGIGDFCDGFINGFKKAFGIHSPSTVMAEQGGYIMKGLLNGISEMLGNVISFFGDLWDGIKNVFAPVGKFFSDTFTNAYNAIKTVFSPVNTWFDEKWKAVKSVFSPTVQFFSETFINAYNAVKTAFSFINTWFQDKWNAVKNVFRDVRQFFKEKFEAGYNAVKAAFNAINTWFSDKWTAVKNVFKDVKTFFSDAFQNAYNAVTRIWDDIGGYFKGIARKIIGPIEKAINGVINGINWILERVGSKTRLDVWPGVEGFATGTNGLPRDTIGVVNDQKGSVYKELIVPPHGKPFIPEGRNVVLPMEKGTKIMPAKQTKAFMNGMPHFAGGIGDFLSGAWEAIKNFTGNVMDYLTKPSEILKIALDKFVNMSGWSGIYGDIASGAISKVFNNVSDYIKGIFDDIVPEVSYNASAGVEQWRQLAIHALRITGQLSDSNVNALLMQMQHESGGNPNAINNWDINAKRGTPSKGLMQVIDPTFRTWALSPYDKNIYDPLSNMIAAIRYTVSRYGSLYNGWTARGYKGYATGIGAIRISDLIPKYQVGGFPEDGLFYANHNEVVGQFANGKTAVANNYQIEEGIEEASYRGFMRAMREMSPYLRDIADNTKKTAEKDMSVRIGDRDIVESYRRGSTRMGYAFSR